MFQLSAITASGATISWTTNEAADSRVDYGPTTAYGSISVDSSLVTSHKATLTGLTAGTVYHYQIKSKDAAGNLVTSADLTFTTVAAADTTPPTVSLTSPSASTVSGTVAVSANASDNVKVVGVQFKLNGSNLGTEYTSSPYSLSWNTTTIPNGSHTLTAVARDAAGNKTTSAAKTVTVNNPVVTPPPPADTTAPTVSLTSPSASTVSGSVTISATASDNVGVVGVQFKLDGANLGTEYTSSPYSLSWNTTTIANGSHTLTAVARDAAGNKTTSAAKTVTVNNPVVTPPPPADTTAPTVSLTSPSASTVSGTVTVSANASDNVKVVGVQFKLNGANLGTECTSSPYSLSWNTTTIANGSHTLTAVARDAAGNKTTSAAKTVTVNNPVVTPPPPADTTAPTVSLTSPSASTVSGTVAISATASDNVGVVGVQFKLNGSNLGTEYTSSPYSLSWNTTTVANGSHTLTAVARDAAGNKTTSAAKTVTVNNPV